MLSKSSHTRGYVDLQKQVVRDLKKAKIQRQIFDSIERSFNAVLAEEGLVLSRAERRRLLGQVTRDILSDLLPKLEKSL